MKFVLLALTFVFLQIAYSQAPVLDWGYTTGLRTTAIAKAEANHLIVGGYYSGTMDLDPGYTTLNYTSQGSSDCFLQKIDTDSNLIWAKSFGGSAYDEVYDISIDKDGNIITVGTFGGTTDMDPGASSYLLTAVGAKDVFIQKLSSNGDFIWAKSFGGTSWDYPYGCAVDTSGNIFITGSFANTVDFDPGPGTNTVTSTGEMDIFVVKFDPNGILSWANTHGSTGYEYGFDIAVDESQNVISVGTFDWTIDFDPGPAVQNLSVTLFWNSYIQKLDNDGNYIWAKSMEGGTNFAHGIEVDDTNNIYVIGFFQDSIDTDMGIGTNISFSQGGRDIYFGKYDSLGNAVWSNTIGASLSETGYAIDVDHLGNTYITGIHRVPGPGIVNDINTLDDILIGKYDQVGNMVWLDSLGGDAEDVGDAILVDSLNVYIVGKVMNQADIDPGPLVQYTDASVHKGIVLKLDTCLAISSHDVISSCSPYTWVDGITYASSNNSAMYVYPSVSGCDSVVFLDLTINSPDTVTETVNACDSYTWINGITYTNSTNTPVWTLSNMYGCDSVVHLDLTMHYSNNGVATISACDSYTWLDGITYTSSTNTPTFTLTTPNGCDSIVHLNLTINTSSTGTDVQTACDSYTWIDGNTYSSSTNTPTWILTNATGCDSTVQLNLTINSADNSIVQTNEITLQAGASNATYQWLDCDNNTPLNGATNQTYIATFNGNFAVEVTQNGCIGVSDCITISDVGLDEISDENGVHIFPNPTNGNLVVQVSGKTEKFTLGVYDNSGRIIMPEKYYTTNEALIQLEGSSGMYHFVIIIDEAEYWYKVLKK